MNPNDISLQIQGDIFQASFKGQPSVIFCHPDREVNFALCALLTSQGVADDAGCRCGSEDCCEGSNPVIQQLTDDNVQLREKLEEVITVLSTFVPILDVVANTITEIEKVGYGDNEEHFNSLLECRDDIIRAIPKLEASNVVE